MSGRESGLPVHPGARRSSPDSLDIDALRELLRGPDAPPYWRSLEELAGTPAFEAFLHAEFPQEIPHGLDRREMFKFAGVSLALAGLTACTRQPAQKIV